MPLRTPSMRPCLPDRDWETEIKQIIKARLILKESKYSNEEKIKAYDYLYEKYMQYGTINTNEIEQLIK